MIEVEKENFSEDGDESSKLKKTLTFNEILCTAILFFAAGYETTSTTLTFLAYNLALNQDCQDKLCKEIDQILEKHVSF
jgi:cytochrome P450